MDALYEKVVVQRALAVQLTAHSNALAETINGLYKAEMIHRRTPWKTREAVELDTLEWVSWFNHHRLLEPIGGPCRGLEETQSQDTSSQLDHQTNRV